MALIRFENVHKTYTMGESAFHALKGISFTIEAGEMLAIIGTSGSGKTTTMHIMGLLDRATEGNYLLKGKSVNTYNTNALAQLRNLEIGFVFQSFFLLPKLNALQNASLPLVYRDEDGKIMRRKALETLEKVGMDQFASHRPNELSGGQKQRVAIARALIGNPSIILADEPTGALDANTSQDVMNLLIKLHKEDNKTIIIVTHDPAVAQQCNRMIRLDDGNIIEDGPTHTKGGTS